MRPTPSNDPAEKDSSRSLPTRSDLGSSDGGELVAAVALPRDGTLRPARRNCQLVPGMAACCLRMATESVHGRCSAAPRSLHFGTPSIEAIMSGLVRYSQTNKLQCAIYLNVIRWHCKIFWNELCPLIEVEPVH